MFKTRLLSGIVLVIILIATVGLGGNVLFALLLAVSLIGMTELYQVVEARETLLGVAGYLAAAFYYRFLYRRLAYLYIEYKMFDEAKHLLEQMKNDEADRDFALGELEYLKNVMKEEK